MDNIFANTLEIGRKLGQIPHKSKTAVAWYRNTAQKLSASPQELLKDKVALRTNFLPGELYLYMYDPKGKDTLPYYDRFPLIFPFKKQGNSFLGLNMHYLPYMLRAKLMDALYTITTNSKFDGSTMLKMSYQTLKGASEFRYFKPTLKRYLLDHVRSRFLYIHPSEWDIAIWLPLARFQKATEEEVWADSRKLIGV